MRPFAVIVFTLFPFAWKVQKSPQITTDVVKTLLYCVSSNAGEILSILDTRQMNNSFAAISPCGRFVASAGKQIWLFS